MTFCWKMDFSLSTKTSIIPEFCRSRKIPYQSSWFGKKSTQEPAGISLAWKDMIPGSCREFAATLDGQEVCWGQVHFLPQGSIAYLRWIYVDEAFQHKGIGTNIMRALFSDLYEMGITRFDTDTARSNAAARSYYEKCGFTNEGITRSYFTK